MLTDEAIENAMLVHAAFGGSTNLLIHIPAIAHAAGLRRPTVDDWRRVNASVPRLVDALPNGPNNHPTVRVFLAGGVPEVMLHLRRLGLLHVRCADGRRAAPGTRCSTSGRRASGGQRLRARLLEADGVDPDDVICPPGAGTREGDDVDGVLPGGEPRARRQRDQEHRDRPAALDEDGIYRLTGPARVFTSERDAIAAIKGSRG